MVPMDRQPLRMTAFFGLLGEHFVAGRLAEAARVWSFPCPVEMDGQLVVVRSAAAFVAYLADRRDAALAAGLTALTPRVSAIEMPRKGRFRVWLRWVSHFGDRRVEQGHGTVYFLAFQPDGQLTIEMMDIVQLPSPLAIPAAQSA